MQQVIETKKNLPLDSIHRANGAEMIVRDGWMVPESYGDPGAEYAAVRSDGAGLIDITPRGHMLISGSEAVQFLNGLISNDMKTLEPGVWMSAALPNVQGRILAALRVARLSDEKGDEKRPKFLIDTEAPTHETVFKNFQKFTLAGDFSVEDLTETTAMVSVAGPAAATVIAKVISAAAAELPPNGVSEFQWANGAEITVMRGTLVRESTFDVMVDALHAADLWTSLVEAGARAIGYQTFEVLRIEAGIPRFAIDMDETNVVTETSLDDAVSYTKGCYLGQEIIARIKYRGHVAKKLRGLRFQTKARMTPGATVSSMDGREIGKITSATLSPKLDCTIALAYLKYDYIAAGTTVMVAAGTDAVPAEVSQLPFI